MLLFLERVTLSSMSFICSAAKKMMYHSEHEDKTRRELKGYKSCALSGQCMKNKVKGRGRQIQFLNKGQKRTSYLELMKKIR